MQDNGPYKVVIVEDRQTGRAVGTGCLFIEYKFIRNAGKVGHLDDIAIEQNHQGTGLGKR